MIYCRFTIEVGLLKQADTSAFLKAYPSWVLEIASLLPGWTYITKSVPIIALILLAQLLLKNITRSHSKGVWKFVMYGTILCYILIGFHWALENDMLHFAPAIEGIGKNCIPRIIYATGLGQLSLLLFRQLFGEEKLLDCRITLLTKTAAMLAAWSPTIIILAGKQGSLVALASLIGGEILLGLHYIINCIIVDPYLPTYAAAYCTFSLVSLYLYLWPLLTIFFHQLGLL